jgi:protein SCO1/2
MADVAVALRKLPRATRNKVTVVFVTTDPERDSAAAIRSWLKYFSAPIIGLTGTRAEVEAAQTAAQVTIARPKPKEKAPAGPASTAHGGGILAYGSDNYAHVTYPAGTSSADLVHDLPGLTRAGH